MWDGGGTGWDVSMDRGSKSPSLLATIVRRTPGVVPTPDPYPPRVD